MPFARAHFSGPTRRARGYAMLMVLGLLAAAVLLALMTVALSSADTSATLLETQEDRALAAAEAGLDRTTAFLDALLLNGEADFDRALDPLDDDICVPGPPFSVARGDDDDHLPPFADGTAALLPGWSGGKRRFLEVAWPDAGAPEGAYFVRIDDDDDDLGPGSPAATGNHPGPASTCAEGSGLSANQWSNPVRDRDRVVVVTVVGIAPGTDFARAHARRTLRSVAGQSLAQGIVAGGEVDAGSGGVSVCGPYADLYATGKVDLGDNLCSACGGTCQPERVLARTSERICHRGNGACLANVDALAVRDFDPLDARFRPPACTTPTGCTPFYRLTTQGLPKLFMWSYAACPNPRSTSLPDNCFTGGGCGPACWLDVSGATQSGANIFLDDTDAGLDKSVPAPAGYLLLSDAFKVFHLENAGFAGSCADKHGRSIPPALFRYDPKLPDRPGAPVLPLPHGVWIIDGSLKFDIGPNHDMPYCPAWWSGAELLVRGSATFGNRGYFFKPPPQLETVLVVGGDLALQSGVSLFSSCASGAAVVVREQAKLGGRNLLASPLVVTDTAHCMSEVLGETALELASPAGIEIDFPPVFNVFPVKSLAWSESAL